MLGLLQEYRLYKIIAINTHSLAEEVVEFDKAEDALLYKRYQLRFGKWANGTYWIDEDKVTEELRPFIVDEIAEVENGLIKRKYLVSNYLSIKEEEVTGSELLDCWIAFRKERNTRLALSDWTQIADVPILTADRGEWKRYRQYLRDITKLHTDDTISKAKIATFDEWREGAR